MLARRVYNEEVNRRLQQDTILSKLDPYVDKDSVSIDVGAATGHITNYLAPRSHTVFAFEAVEPVFHQLTKMAQRHKNVAAVHLAVGLRPGVERFYVDDKRLSNSGFQDLVGGPSVEIETSNLDTIFHPDAPIGFIKVDVEGTELDVLQGANRILRKQRPNLMVEIYEPYSKDPLDQIFRYLFGLGYRAAYYDGDLVEVSTVEDGVDAVKTKHAAHDGDFLFYGLR